ncbi:MAG: LamG domain-containing protein, partial [Verrucomicrobia bacterium]|nr:LamG domain-containing protein [Verrucomicrobiota bacterium]
RTVTWDNPQFLRSLSATIGSKLADHHANPSDFGLLFGGSDSAVVKTIAGMDPAAGAFSVEAWVRIDAPPVKRQGILSLGDNATLSQFWVATVSSNRPETHAQLRLGRLNTSPFITTVEIPLYTWVHIATTWDPSAGTMKAFLNGLPAGLATAGGFNRGKSRLVMGAPAVAGESGLIGALDEVRTWNRALAESEVALNAKAAPPANSPGLIGWYRFEGPDNVAVDSAPAGGLSGLDTITGARVGLDGDPGHQDYNKKTGFVFFERAFYDGAGPDRAYSRATRTGVIIPVNREPNGDNTVSNDLVVVWYRLNPIGVAWASKPARYQLSWPADDAVSKIVIASGKGTSALPPTYKSPRVYNQPDSTLAGYNPNEEHALIAPSADGVGDAMFALRNDLNAVLPVEASKPYALLKYKDAATDEWSIQVYKVLAEDATYKFQYTGTAGTEIQPPYPLTLLGVCADSTGVAGPWWEDYKGRLYARAAGVNGNPTDVVIRWFYPLQPGFFYDFDFNGDNKVDATVGDCVAWLDHHPAAELVGLNSGAGTPGVPVNVTYRIVWPEAPILQIGESLLDPKPGGLPGVRNMAAAKIIYDDLTPGWNPLIDTNAPTSTLAHLYDPLSTRVYKLTGTDKIPDTIRRSNRSGKEFFDDLPPTLYPRLTYDPISKWILFSGLLDTTSFAGEPLLMPNVLSSRERDVIKGLSDSATWKGMIDKLYEITRNPNRVDLLPADQNPDASTDSTVGNPTPGLRLGLIKVGDRIVPESFGGGPKALTAGLSTVPPATEQPLFALSLDGSQAYADLTPGIVIGPVFTQEAWLYPKPTASASNLIFGVAGNVAAALRPPSLYLYQGNRLLGGFGDGKVWRSFSTPAVITPNAWNHVAVTFDGSIYKVFVNAVMVYSTAAFDGLTPATTPLTRIGGAESFFQGKIEEVRFWSIARTVSSLNHLKRLRLDGYEDGLLANWRFDEGSGSTAFDNAAHTNKYNLTLRGTAAYVASDAPTGIPPRYLTIAENDDSRLGLKINLHIIRIEDGPFRGDLKPIYPSSVFDERLTMRHSSDFGGDAGQVTFEWYYKPDGDTFDPKVLPEVGADGSINAPNGWIFYSNMNPKSGLGVNDITLGDGGESGLLTLGDNWFLCRYRGYNVRGDTNWSGWVGGPDGTPDSPRPLLAEGFIKRVIRGLNPFDARVKDFHSAPSSTIVSMISQAGQRYEGDIAFNPAADAINNVGLIEAYTTVLNVGKKLSIEGSPPVNFNPANNALLLAVSRIADFYMLLGNEAYADAQDPTIGFGTTGGAYGSAAPAIFTFQNQLDSPLEEELVLLRGRDDSSAGVAARPVYNRLYWNFTLGDGEVAYQQNYNISDINKDGFIDEKDARVMFPQGHGDAWGHYLTALTTYYGLLRHPNFTWVPRPESVLVAGVAVKVDYLDERKFARAASARAKAGREIVDLTYRLNYVEEPAGQWQGYKDTDRDRAWGVDEWARRAGQGAYFDWLIANSILPSVDPNPAHKGIQKIDRTTVRELAEISSGYAAIEQIMDKADKGLNPLGIATGAVPFDIDPSKVAAGLTHFDQIYQRALKTMDNSLTLFNNANAQSQALRKNNDSLESFVTGVNEKERDLKNRMIEVFGYPYAGDIGPGGAYPSGYDGPDIVHYMYVNASALTGTLGLPKTETVAYYRKTQDTSRLDDNYYVNFDPEDHAPQNPGTDPDAAFTVTYPTSTGDYLFEAKTEWGQRRAPGKLQISLQDLLRAEAKLKGAVAKYETHIGLINDTVDLLEAQDNLNSDKIGIKTGELAALTTMTAVQIGLKATSVTLKRTSAVVGAVGTTAVMSIPTVVGLASDVASAARGIINGTVSGFRQALETTADTLDVVEYSTKELKETVKLSFALALEVETQKFDTLQRVKTLEQLIRQEVALRLEALELKEALNQALGNYLAALAQGVRIIDERVGYRKLVAAQITDYRYQDMAFRIFQNDALQKYRAQFDLTAMYVYLAAKAYDYETCLLGTDAGSGNNFLTDIVRHRNLGQVIGGIPVSGGVGLADPLARLGQNFEVYRSQLGFLTPETETGRFSLRNELFRMKPSSSNDPASTVSWHGKLKDLIVPDLWQMPEFRKYCRPFAPESAGKQPGIVIRFPTSIMFGQNFFLWPLSGGDSAYDPSRFATKVRSAGVWFTGYDGNGLSITPRVYLFPAGQDMMRSPSANNLETREFTIVDQKLPVPFPIGTREMGDPSWIPLQDSLSETFADIRRFSMFRAYHDAGSFTEAQAITDTRLIGRSVWNTDWILIIPGGSLLANPDQGLDQFIKSVSDIKLFFQTYAYSGN